VFDVSLTRPTLATTEGRPLVWTPQTGTLVILLAPEALGADGREIARVRLSAAGIAPDRTRGLVCLVDPDHIGFAHEAAREFGAATQWLLGPEVAAETEKPIAVVRMPKGTAPNQQIDFALALSDVVVAIEAAADTPIVKRARELGKIVVAPGEPLTPLPPASGLAEVFDPARWSAMVWRHISGRLEKLLLEVIAFPGSGWSRAGLAASLEALSTPVRWKWRPTAYFVMKETDNPIESERAMLAALAPVVARYKELDVSALYGSRLHRDMIWIVHLSAAFAVLAAVAGKLYPKSLPLDEGWSWVELIALLAIFSLIVWARVTHLHGRWTACRLAAEQLRIACMCLPLCTAPPALMTKEPARPHGGAPPTRRQRDFTLEALALVKRAVRDPGAPKTSREMSFPEAVRWLDAFVEDQIKYHSRNHLKLETAERRLTLFATLLFILSFVGAALEIDHVRDGLARAISWLGLPPEALAVSSALLDEPKWLLLVTAAGPAFAAALHGAETRLGIVHRSELSKSMAEELGRIRRELLDARQAAQEDWPQLHKLAFRAAAAMGDENTSWHSLLRRSPDTTP
jgi:hypothetical protein